jgi:hypothetical protein
MWFSAIANYKGGLAHYKVVRENVGIFNAYLERYDGKAANTPAQTIILVRGARHWSGSVDDQTLLDKLGEVIDRKTKGRLHFMFYPTSKRDGKEREL